MNSTIQKFVRAYKMAERLKKSDTTQTDIVQAAKKIYQEDNNGDEFCLDHAWRLLKNEMKWFTHNNPTADSSKKAKISESKAYTSGSNSKSEYNLTSSNLVCPQRKKAAKKKRKEKLGKTSANDVGKATEALKKLANVRKRQINVNDEYNKRLEKHTKRIDIRFEEHTKRLKEHTKWMEKHKKANDETKLIEIFDKDTSIMNE